MPLWPITFQDADFEHRFAWCWSELEGRSLRWTPFGVPRLNPVFQNSVFFLFGKSPKTGETEGPAGTGVLVGLEGGLYTRHLYAVTCQHVATQGASIIRLNTRDGASRFVELEPHEWQFDPKGDDIAAVDITDRLQLGVDAYSPIQSRLFATKDFMNSVEFGIGEDGFMLGLFADQPGKKRNLIAARFGNVSLLADDDEPVEQGNKNLRPSHLFDMRSRTGFSGSPVFAYRTPAGDLRTASERGDIERTDRMVRGGRDPSRMTRIFTDLEVKDNTFLVLLGIHSGQYHDVVKAEKATAIKAERREPIHEGDELVIPNSVAVVVPAWQVLSLLDLDVFVRQRRERDMAYEQRKKNVAHPEAISHAKSAPDATADNPSHKEDFMSLVSAATKTRPRAGRTSRGASGGSSGGKRTR